MEDELIDRDVALHLLRDNLVKARERMKKFADRKRCEREFEVGDLVFLRLQPYKQISVGGQPLKNSLLSSLDPILCCRRLVRLRTG